MIGAGRRRHASRRERPADAVDDVEKFRGLELPAAVVREAMGTAGLEPVAVARLLGLSDHWELVIRHIVGLTKSTHGTRTHVTREHAIAIADAIAQVDRAAAARLGAAIEQAEETWLAEAVREARRSKRAAAAARRCAAASSRRKASMLPVEVLARIVERVDATPHAIARLTGRRPHDVRVMLGLRPTSKGRVQRNVTVASARSIAAALVTVARGPYEKRILARELTHAQAATGISLVEGIPR